MEGMFGRQQGGKSSLSSSHGTVERKTANESIKIPENFSQHHVFPAVEDEKEKELSGSSSLVLKVTEEKVAESASKKGGLCEVCGKKATQSWLNKKYCHQCFMDGCLGQDEKVGPISLLRMQTGHTTECSCWECYGYPADLHFVDGFLEKAEKVKPITIQKVDCMRVQNGHNTACFCWKCYGYPGYYMDM